MNLDETERALRAIMLAGGLFFWLIAGVVGWQEGYGLGGALAGSLFVLCQAPLWVR